MTRMSATLYAQDGDGLDLNKQHRYGSADIGCHCLIKLYALVVTALAYFFLFGLAGTRLLSTDQLQAVVPLAQLQRYNTAALGTADQNDFEGRDMGMNVRQFDALIRQDVNGIGNPDFPLQYMRSFFEQTGSEGGGGGGVQLRPNARDMVRMFEQLDLDGNGLLSVPEFKAVNEEGRLKLSELIDIWRKSVRSSDERYE